MRSLLKEAEDKWLHDFYGLLQDQHYELIKIENRASKDRSIHRPGNLKSRAYKDLGKILDIVDSFVNDFGKNSKQSSPEPREPRSWDNEPG